MIVAQLSESFRKSHVRREPFVCARLEQKLRFELVLTRWLDAVHVAPLCIRWCLKTPYRVDCYNVLVRGRRLRSTAMTRQDFACKDIEAVMAASASLVRPTKRLTPPGVVKG
jgi:hypothetical protein